MSVSVAPLGAISIPAFSAHPAPFAQVPQAAAPGDPFGERFVPDVPTRDVSETDVPATDAAAEVDASAKPASAADAGFFEDLLAQSSQAFARAQNSEAAVVAGHGSLLDMTVDRARADAILGVLATGASRFSSALQTFANMSV